MNNKITFSGSCFETRDGVDYLVLREENYYKTGFAYGSLLVLSGNKLILFFKSFKIRAIFSIIYFFKRKRLYLIKVPERYKEELEGFSQASGIKYEYLLLANLIYEIGCSGFGFLNSDKSLLVGHNTDTMKSLANILLRKANPLVVSVSIPGKNLFTTVSLPGFVGVANGFNDKGIAISSHDAGSIYYKRIQNNTSSSCVLRMILEEANNLKDVEQIVRNNPAYHPGLMLIASEKEQSFGILELYPGDMNFISLSGQTYVFTANHYHSEKMQKYHKEINAGSIKRYDFLKGCFVDKKDLSIDEAITILKNTQHGTKRDTTGHSVANEGTFQSFIFDVTNHCVYISNGNKVPVPLNGNFIKIKTVDELLK
ncbi:MAG: hypothetical protein EXS46_03125 [Candidatus Taylorbacteria bacterium]|nr:hypothetical protein [Candidatus Taylorbacteria bacterium]